MTTWMPDVATVLLVHVTNAPTDKFRPPGRPTGWEVDLRPEMGNPVPGDSVRIRKGRAPATSGRVYAVDYATNKLYVELLEGEMKTDERG